MGYNIYINHQLNFLSGLKCRSQWTHNLDKKYIIEIKPENLENAEKILKKDSIHFDKLGLVEGNEITYGDDLKISIDDIKQGYKKWLKEYMVS